MSSFGVLLLVLASNLIDGMEMVQSSDWRKAMSKESELLVGLTDDELEALADSLLAPSAQARLDELLARNAVNELSEKDQVELDRLLARVDQLTILKTRATYTLRQQAGATGV